MSITVTIEINREFDVPASPDTVYELLADVPRSVSHFPKVEKLEPLGDNRYRWVMNKVGVDKHALQTIYACEYRMDPTHRRIEWVPVKNEGNGVVRGHWEITPAGGGTHIAFHTVAELTVNAPAVLKLAISPVIRHEFNALVDTYTRNLKKTWSA